MILTLTGVIAPPHAGTILLPATPLLFNIFMSLFSVFVFTPMQIILLKLAYDCQADYFLTVG